MLSCFLLFQACQVRLLLGKHRDECKKLEIDDEVAGRR